MKKMKIKEIFYSLQGEGHWTGRPAVFVRFTGCNLDCPFCDTDFKGGEEYTKEELIRAIQSIGQDCRFVVFTGGEPTLQLTEEVLSSLHSAGYYLAMETNGTRPYPKGLDWVTVSPKNDFCERSILCSDNLIASEVKVVYTGGNEPTQYASLGVEKYIQPCDTGNAEENRQIVSKSIDWLKAHPDWKLSLQTQKIINVR